jgi:hypothetical protein
MKPRKIESESIWFTKNAPPEPIDSHHRPPETLQETLQDCTEPADNHQECFTTSKNCTEPADNHQECFTTSKNCTEPADNLHQITEKK